MKNYCHTVLAAAEGGVGIITQNFSLAPTSSIEYSYRKLSTRSRSSLVRVLAIESIKDEEKIKLAEKIKLKVYFSLEAQVY